MSIFSVFRFCFGCIPQRFVMGIMAFFGIFMAYICRNCLNIAIVDMVQSKMAKGGNATSNECKYGSTKNATNTTAKSSKAPRYNWNDSEQSMILTYFFWGYFASHIPGGLAADYFGAKHIFGGGILVSAVLSLLSPLAAKSGVTVFLILRIIMGIAQGVLFPAANVLLARWIPPAERGTMGSFVLAATQIGNVASNAISGQLMEHVNWMAVFYFWGGLGILWYIIYSVSVYNDPNSHPFIKDKEKDFLNEQIPIKPPQSILKIPFLSMFLSLPVWAIIVCQFGHNYGLFTMQTYFPKYLKSVLKYDAASNGLVSSLPYLSMWIVAILSGILIDVIIAKGYMSRLACRRIFCFISQVCPAIGCVLACYAKCNRALAVSLFTIGMGLMGPFWPSMKVNALDLAPNYAGMLMAITNGLGALAGRLTGVVFEAIVPKKGPATHDNWVLVFWIAFAFLVVTGVFYVIFSKADVQIWNFPKEEQEAQLAAQQAAQQAAQRPAQQPAQQPA